MASEKASVLLLNLAAMVERADEALLPALYAEVSADLGVGLPALEWITFVRALVQALAAPMAAYLALRHNRVHIVAAGAFCWALATASVAVSTSFWQAALARALNGVGLAIVAPAILSLVADFTRDESRGVAFGWLYGAGQIGSVAAGAFVTLMGSHTVMGIGGWRAVFICMSLSSILMGLAIFTLGHDPRANQEYSQIGENYHAKSVESQGAAANVEEFIQGSKLVLKVKTFQILVVQGVLGRLPWHAVVFLAPWMRLIGFSHSAASHVVSLLFIGSACGSVVGGWVGDRAARWSPNKGRIICSQFSAGMGIPLSAVLLIRFPTDTGSLWTYGSMIFTLGFLISWILPATSWPIFSEVVPEELRTTIFAIDLAIEKFFSAFSAPLVAFVAKRLFGHRNMKATVEDDEFNSSALGKAFFACISVPCVCVILIMFLVYVTYPKDREQAKNVKALADEIRALEMGENWENEEDRVWDDGWEDVDEDDDDLDLTLLLERERLRDQGIT
ncbi:hypothetical protein MPTK2_3g19640 [Marchantia polymorpha subsp. ruderalis]